MAFVVGCVEGIEIYVAAYVDGCEEEEYDGDCFGG